MDCVTGPRTTIVCSQHLISNMHNEAYICIQYFTVDGAHMLQTPKDLQSNSNQHLQTSTNMQTWMNTS